LESLSKELKTSKQERVLDFLVVGDFNQDIEGEQMKVFMRENGLFDIHSTMNPNNERDRDNKYKTGSKQIDAVLSIPDLLDSIQGSKLVDFHEVGEYESSDNVTLDSTKRSHKKKFKDKIKEYIDQLKLEDTINNLYNSRITGQEIDRLDDTITFVLNAAHKYIEENQRRIPASTAKVKVQYFITKG